METLYPYKLQIIETIVLLVLMVIVKLISRKAVGRILTRWELDLQRKKISQKIINLFIILTAILILAGIWNIHQDQLMVFVTSVITILGIAFFAQWSIISNVTASLILFFNHPLRIGEEIQILDKEFSVKGRLEDISFFFMHIRSEDGELITIPNNLALQKMIQTRKIS
ncbi:MAG: mechanosensitive ion channel domain-containing protein [Bacteroidota bacterium]|jgi:small-conductance mechanosensitive channel